MEVKQLNSSNISQVAYDNTTDVLRVFFNNGTIYDFQAVDEQTYRYLLAAPSAGNYFYKYIKNRFAYVKVDPLLS